MILNRKARCVYAYKNLVFDALIVLKLICTSGEGSTDYE